MARTKHGKTRTVPYRRKRQGKTNYKKRLTMLKSGSNRVVIRRSLNTITAQIVQYHPDGDKIVASATSTELQKTGWKMHKANMPSAYLTGLLLGIKAKKKKSGELILDFGLQLPRRQGKLYAVLKGLLDAGVSMTYNKEALPSEERISGKHIADYANQLKKDPKKYQTQFSRCIKEGVAPEDICKQFEEAKKKIMAM